MVHNSNTITGFRLSPQQKHLWLQQPASVNYLPYCTRCVVLIEGKLYPNILKIAVDQVVERYEILRTTFPRLPEMAFPIQVITQSSPTWEEKADLSEIAQPVFDLEQGSLLHLSLVKLSSTQYFLSIILPALCADAVTLKNLVQEISHCYAACLQDKEPYASTDEPIQYADIAEWQNQLIEAEDTATGRDYWQQQDVSTFCKAKLPFDQQIRTAEFAPQFCALQLSSKLVTQLKAIAQANNTSISVLLLACWQVLLYRLTRQSDLVIGTSFNNRKYEELKLALGLFAKTLPIQADLEDNLSFDQLLEQTNKTVANAAKWQEYFTWEDITKTSELEQLNFFPLCFASIEAAPIDSAGVEWKIQQIYSCTERFDLKLLCIQQQNQLNLEWHYDSQKYQPQEIEQLTAQMQVLLASIVAHPTATIAELEILTPQQQQQILIDFNRTTVNYPPTQSIHQLFETQVEKYPDQIAVVDETQQLTYSELNQRANQLAYYLLQHGIKPEVPVGLCVERSIEMLIGLLGILKAGGAYVPLEPTLPAAALGLRLAQVSAPLVVTRQSLAQLPADNIQVICLDADADQIASLPVDNPRTNVTPEHLVYILYTSGSSGIPKAVAVEHRQLINYVYSIQHRLELQPSFSYGWVSTIAADLGNTMLFGALCTGGCLQILSTARAMDATALAEYCTQHPLDCLKIVPTHLKALLAATNAPHFLPRQRLILGGETLDWQLMAQLRSQLAASCQIYNHYGPTEATVGVLTERIYTQTSASTATVPLGRPLDNTQIYLLSEARQPVAIGVVGEVYIGGANVARGYFNQPELTAQQFVPNPFAPGRLYKTGDYARYLPDGRLEFCGRVDFQLKWHGFRIELGEIESVLKQHPLVQAAVVMARQDEAQPPRLVAYVVLHPDQSLDCAVLRQFLLLHLPEYMIPSVLMLLPCLPLSPNGKLDFSALPEPEITRPDLETRFVAPRNSVEALIASIWAELLHLEHIGVYDNFFELGGHSLLATQVISRARDAFGVELPLRDFLAAPAIADLAASITEKLAEDADEELLAETLAELEQLSEQEAKTLLNAGKPELREIDE